MKRPTLIASVVAGLAVSIGFFAWRGPHAGDFRGRILPGSQRPVATEALFELPAIVALREGTPRPVAAHQDIEEVRRRALGRLLVAVERGDTKAVGSAVSDWFGSGPGGVEALFERMAGASESESVALGLLLATAVHLAEGGSPSVAPWTVVGLAEDGIASIAWGDGAARAIAIGLQNAGPHLPGSLAVDVLRQYGSAEIDLLTQVEVVGLAGRWSQTMGPDVEEALLLCAADFGEDTNVRGQASVLLLEKDWQWFAPLLTEDRRSRTEQELAAYTTGFGGAPMAPYTMAHFAGKLPANERSEFAALVARDPATGFAVLGQLDSIGLAAFVAEHGENEEIPVATRRMARLLDGGEGAIAAGLALLREGSNLPWHGEGEVIAALVSRGALGTPDFDRAMEAHFERHRGDAGFWSDLNFAVQHMDEHDLAVLVLPWLERTEGDPNANRRQLLTRVSRKLPNLDLR